ncbi:MULTISPECIES: Bug family tripartite tricarboxylate transporter substrate binding protein [unclassified Tardiphaga]|jgi:tripartite-type tricarboxylate transporter receptor subunit TctC|uniref:Bug family tripartite tricarboxylate transporter substrate binding protein n=1 Tax=unclassified Tardiphaga TaxID=2631404 RepID=UPI000B72E2CB|nr:tripartite tricarboxylate transporter substrate binding protein [Tardiphaga sp. OK246]SNS99859.1 Tripartite-type tricarboxylate transporter, receptor component TctC [Tardiphaga sp. OK246]
MSDSRQVEVVLRASRLVHFACRTLILLLAGTACVHAQATAPANETFPSKTIKYIVPYPPGGFNDTLGRIFAQKLQDAWGVPVVVENRPGGGTLIGTEAVAKSAPDGYTLLGVAFPFGSNPSIYKNLPYDTVKDFTPLVFAGQTPNLLVVKPSLPINTVKELIDYANKNPGKVSYGSTGIGSSNHLSMELFKSLARIDIVHVPYKGSAPMVNDMLGGHIDVAFDNTPNVLPQVNGGKLRALGVSSKTRSTLAPDIPTVSDAGVAGYEVNVWFGVVGPAGMPEEIVRKLNAEMNAILKQDDVRRRFIDQGVEPVGGTPAQFADQIKTEIQKWARVVKDAGIKPE